MPKRKLDIISAELGALYPESPSFLNELVFRVTKNLPRALILAWDRASTYTPDVYLSYAPVEKDFYLRLIHTFCPSASQKNFLDCVSRASFAEVQTAFVKIGGQGEFGIHMRTSSVNGWAQHALPFRLGALHTNAVLAHQREPDIFAIGCNAQGHLYANVYYQYFGVLP